MKRHIIQLKIKEKIIKVIRILKDLDHSLIKGKINLDHNHQEGMIKKKLFNEKVTIDKDLILVIKGLDLILEIEGLDLDQAIEEIMNKKKKKIDENLR